MPLVKASLEKRGFQITIVTNLNRDGNQFAASVLQTLEDDLGGT